MFRPLPILLTLALAVSTRAEAGCDAPFSVDDLLAVYQSAQVAIADADSPAILESGQKLEAGLPCLEEMVPPAMMAAAYRIIGVQHYFGEDMEATARWFRTARELEPAFEWDLETIPGDSPIRVLYRSQQPLESQAAELHVGMEFRLPPGGGEFYLDGRPWLEAGASPDRFHLLHLVEPGARQVRAGWLVLGNDFPPHVLQARTAEPVAVQPRGGGPLELEVIGRVRPPMKTPTLIGGGLGLAGALGFYAASYWARQGFEGATTEDELFRFLDLTDTFFWTSTVFLAVGGSLTGFGLYMNGGPGMGYAWTW